MLTKLQVQNPAVGQIWYRWGVGKIAAVHRETDISEDSALTICVGGVLAHCVVVLSCPN
jgi:hypothetical protein